jgi:hypothetical protein
MIPKLFVFHAVFFVAVGFYAFSQSDSQREPSSTQAAHDVYRFMKY